MKWLKKKEMVGGSGKKKRLKLKIDVTKRMEIMLLELVRRLITIARVNLLRITM